MNEIYWLTRLDPILNTLGTFLIISVCIAIFTWITTLVCNLSEMPPTQYIKKIRRISSISTILIMITTTFIPSKNDMLIIYGIGGTIDYINSNDNAKQLPDKSIQAINLWLDNFINNQQNLTTNNNN